jgi:hypothetical protein
VNAVHSRCGVEQSPAARQLSQAFAQVVHRDSLARGRHRRARRPRPLPSSA